MFTLLAIGTGGFVGALSRYWVGRQVHFWLGSGFPYGTLTVNALGSLCLGFLTGVFQNHPTLHPEVRLGLTTGFLGAFTTFSTFSTETVMLILQGDLPRAAINILSNIVVCLTLCFVGMHLAKYV